MSDIPVYHSKVVWYEDDPTNNDYNSAIGDLCKIEVLVGKLCFMGFHEQIVLQSAIV